MGLRRQIHSWLALALIAWLVPLMASMGAARAAEGAAGFYILGSKGSLAGTMAPPGTYYANDNYFYSGDASGSVRLPTSGGELALGLDATVFASMHTMLHVPNRNFLGGRLALGAIVPIIYKDVSADATLNLGGVTIGISETDKRTAFGDPVLTAVLGWSSGNLHTTFNTLLNVPIGMYNPGALANAGFNRWAFDTTLAFTYLDPKVGFEVTVAPGFTFNGENQDTGYRTGTEFHTEFAVMQHFSPQFAIGISGYHYQQVTGDSGTAPAAFKGRVTAIGPAINFNFQLGQLPVSGKAKYLHEFNAENRLEGGAGLIQFVIPLAGPPGQMPLK